MIFTIKNGYIDEKIDSNEIRCYKVLGKAFDDDETKRLKEIKP